MDESLTIPGTVAMASVARRGVAVLLAGFDRAGVWSYASTVTVPGTPHRPRRRPPRRRG
ncbi:hypothetical protein [Halostreptopolyspora alba]|uniref:hypothetical protein n=1 Tax=Halostreptopolyspora alba TaxID=2487137 RepID=UPI003717F538